MYCSGIKLIYYNMIMYHIPYYFNHSVYCCVHLKHPLEYFEKMVYLKNVVDHNNLSQF